MPFHNLFMFLRHFGGQPHAYSLREDPPRCVRGMLVFFADVADCALPEKENAAHSDDLLAALREVALVDTDGIDPDPDRSILLTHSLQYIVAIGGDGQPRESVFGGGVCGSFDRS